MERAPPSKNRNVEETGWQGIVVGKLRFLREKFYRNSGLQESGIRDFAFLAFATIIKLGGELCNF
jgi:hypothetical protein